MRSCSAVGPLTSCGARFAKLAELMDDAEDDALAFMGFPQKTLLADRQHQAAGPREQRTNKEIKRRSRVVGISPNDPAVVRPLGALLIEQTEE